MSKVLTLLGLGAILAIVKAVVLALLLSVLVAGLICLARWPRETLAFVGVVIFGGLASARPGLSLLIVGSAVVLLALAGRIRLRRRRRAERLAHIAPTK